MQLQDSIKLILLIVLVISTSTAAAVLISILVLANIKYKLAIIQSNNNKEQISWKGKYYDIINLI